MQSRSQNAINPSANGVPPHQSYILQTTNRMMGTETDSSDTRETLVTTVTLTAQLARPQPLPMVTSALVKSFVLVVPSYRGKN